MSDSVRIRLDLTQPASQTVWVHMEWTPQWNRQILQLPVWTPGSYTVRDHAQHLHSLRLSNGSTVQKVRRLSPSRWLCELTTLEPLTLTYAIESRDLTVRTGLLDPDFASLSLASVAMEIEGFRWMPHHLEVSAPSHWQVHLPLESSVKGWLAPDFDALIDTPLHAGPFAVEPFTVHGHRHELLLIGAPPFGWPESFISDIERVCQATCDLMGTPPPAGDRYQLVLQLLEKGYGGLEHDHSAVLQFNWSALASKKGYRQLLQLVGHEYLHQWNVRRLRPVELRPYNYSQPVICEGLWFAEGITSYYDLFLPPWAGCTDQTMLLEDFGEELSSVLMSPGRSIQSLSMSAEEAWVKLYKATPASRDTQISYYRLGAAVAFCLDVRLRSFGSSLPVLLRHLWSFFGEQRRGFCRDDLHLWLSSVDSGLPAELDHWLDDTNAIPLEHSAGLIGLRLESVQQQTPHHGLSLKLSAGDLVVQRVMKNSPGMRANLVVGDEILAINGFRVRCIEAVADLMRNCSEVQVSFVRRGLMKETLLQPETAIESWRLDFDPQASSNQLALREQWFKTF